MVGQPGDDDEGEEDVNPPQLMGTKAVGLSKPFIFVLVTLAVLFAALVTFVVLYCRRDGGRVGFGLGIGGNEPASSVHAHQSRHDSMVKVRANLPAPSLQAALLQAVMGMVGCLVQSYIGFGTGIVFLLAWRAVSWAGVHLGPTPVGTVSVLWLDVAVGIAICLSEHRSLSRLMLVLMLPSACTAPLGAYCLKLAMDEGAHTVWRRTLGVVFISVCVAKAVELCKDSMLRPRETPTWRPGGPVQQAPFTTAPIPYPHDPDTHCPPVHSSHLCDAQGRCTGIQPDLPGDGSRQCSVLHALLAREDGDEEKASYEASLLGPQHLTLEGVVLVIAAAAAGFLQGTFGVGGPVYIVYFLCHPPPRLVLRSTVGHLYILTTSAWLIAAASNGVLQRSLVPTYALVLVSAISATAFGLWATRQPACQVCPHLLGYTHTHCVFLWYLNAYGPKSIRSRGP